ncbi:MAG: hypothetical protein ACOYBJ_02590 [Patescibacteria group bacterium]|jgi:hypothetical protein
MKQVVLWALALAVLLGAYIVWNQHAKTEASFAEDSSTPQARSGIILEATDTRLTLEGEAGVFQVSLDEATLVRTLDDTGVFTPTTREQLQPGLIAILSLEILGNYPVGIVDVIALPGGM